MKIDFPFDFMTRAVVSVDSLTSLIFLLVIVFTGVISAIMFFHWNRYALGNKMVVLLTEVIYLGVVVVLLSTAFYSIY